MSSSDGPNDAELSLAAQGRIDRVCLAFEDAWRAGQRPSIERSLDEAAEPERGPLLRELVLLDCYYRIQAGESPVVAEY